MANPQHIEWLLEGVEAWNARRALDDQRLDLSGVNLSQKFRPVVRADTDLFYPLENLNIGNCAISGSQFTLLNLNRANFSRVLAHNAHFNGAKLRDALFLEADLTGSNFFNTELQGTDFRGALLVGCNLSKAALWSANLKGAELRRSDLRGARLIQAQVHGATFKDCDVRTYFEYIPNDEVSGTYEPIYTELKSEELTQKQLDEMLGDSMTVIPVKLKRPDHWPKADWPDDIEGPDESQKWTEPEKPEKSGATQKTTAFPRTKQALRNDAAALGLATASLITQVTAFRETVRTDNEFAANSPDERAELLEYLDTLESDALAFLNVLPSETAELTETQIAKAHALGQRFLAAASQEWSTRLSPEALGKASAPIGLIFLCGAIGALATGLSPLGFGVGTVFGKYLAGELKGGVASDKIAEEFDPPDEQ